MRVTRTGEGGLRARTRRSQGVRRPLGTGARTLQSSGALRSASRHDDYQRRAGAARRADPLTWRRGCSVPTAFAAPRAQPPLDPPTVRRIGAALVKALDPAEGHPHLLIGRDTRESGEWIERELAHGARRAGADVETRRRAADAGGRVPDAHAPDVTLGAVISASHNPYRGQRHQGVLRAPAHKFTEEPSGRSRRSSPMRRGSSMPDEAPPVAGGRPSPRPISLTCATCSPTRARCAARRLVVDCANGATTPVAPRLFRSARLRRRRCSAPRPTGATSTCDCGSTHPRVDGGRRVASRRRLPASRSTATATARSSPTSAGRIVDGDAVMLMCARQLKAEGPPAGQHRRRDRDEQHRPRDGARANRASRCGARRSATST